MDDVQLVHTRMQPGGIHSNNPITKHEPEHERRVTEAVIASPDGKKMVKLEATWVKKGDHWYFVSLTGARSNVEAG